MTIPVPKTRDFLGVNLAMVAKVKFGAPLAMSLNTEQFNLLLQCIGLNLNYTDGLEGFFRFERIKQKEAKDPLKLDISVDCPQVTLKLFDHENERLLLLQAHSIAVSSKLFWNDRVITEIGSEQVNIFDRDLLDSKVPMMYPKEGSRADARKPSGSSIFL